MALIGLIHYEAPIEEQNFSSLVELIDMSETREDDENFENISICRWANVVLKDGVL